MRKEELSYWELNECRKPFDVLIVGGGVTGFSAAIECKMYRPDLRIGLLDSSSFSTRASSKNAGFACFGSLTEMMADLAKLGEEAFVNLVKDRWEGLRLLRQRTGDQQIAFNEFGGYELFLEEEKFEKASASIPKLDKILRTIIGPEVFQIQKDTSLFAFQVSKA